MLNRHAPAWQHIARVVAGAGDDRGRLGILVGNGVVLALAFWQGWSLIGLLLPYLFENLVIGWFTVRRLLHGLREKRPYRTKGGETGSSAFHRCFMAGFFTLHYGLFHVGYVVFLGGMGVASCSCSRPPSRWPGAAPAFRHWWSSGSG